MCLGIGPATNSEPPEMFICGEPGGGGGQLRRESYYDGRSRQLIHPKTNECGSPSQNGFKLCIFTWKY